VADAEAPEHLAAGHRRAPLQGDRGDHPASRGGHGCGLRRQGLSCRYRDPRRREAAGRPHFKRVILEDLAVAKS